MTDPTLTPEYVARLAVGAANAAVAEAEGKIRHYKWRGNPEEVAYWQGKLAEARLRVAQARIQHWGTDNAK